MTPTPTAAPRRRLGGVRMILRYNWPLYLAGLGTAAAGTAVAATPGAGPPARLAAGAAAVSAGWLAAASLAATWWVYDRSALYRWTWLAGCVPEPPGRVLIVHAGLDEASEPLRRLWPAAHVETVDVHGGIGRTTASLRRARSTAGASALRTAAVGGDDTGQRRDGTDVVLAFLAAHELRDPAARDALIADLRRALRPGGRLVLVEHVRDLANAAVYGPAVGHFYPRREWRRVMRGAGLEPVGEERITPFVVVLTATRPRVGFGAATGTFATRPRPHARPR